MTEYSGGCLCGSIRFRVFDPATFPHFCSCRQCQRWSGAPVVAWVDFPATSLRWNGPGGEPSVFRSSARTQRVFCRDCGSTLAALDDGSDKVCMTIATFDEPNLFVPESQSYPEHAPRWLKTEVVAPSRVSGAADDGE